MKKSRWVWVGAIGVAMLVFLSLFAAPNKANLRQGSTYSRDPSGYGAWYAYMQEQGADIQRWQRPLEDLIQPTQAPENPIEKDAVPIEYRQKAEGVDGWMGGWGDVHPLSFIFSFGTLREHPLSFSPQSTAPQKQATVLSPQSSITLLQVDNGLGWLGLSSQQWKWIEQGNVLIQLGNTSAMEGLDIDLPVTRSPFTSVLTSAVGGVKVETSRRYIGVEAARERLEKLIASRLADPYGTVVLERKIGKGKVIIAITPYLAANAYQDEMGNFEFLEQLITEAGNPVWVDEYLHGYKDQAVIAEETSGSLLHYLANTPLALVAVQAIVLLLALIWGLNQRLGPPMALDSPKMDNSEAYIRALAAVLHKANCSEFVVETVGKAEQRQVQRSLGLGNDLLEPATVIAAWVQQTGRSAAELEAVLQPAIDRRRLSEQELLAWLGKVRSVRRYLP